MKRIVLVVLWILIPLAPLTAFSGQVACPRVISELNRVERKEENRVLAMEKVAKLLNTNPIWIENCMRIYGRAVPRRVQVDQDLREELLEHLEEVDIQPEDEAAEDLTEPDPPKEPELESAGTKKRKNREHILRHQYLPQ